MMVPTLNRILTAPVASSISDLEEQEVRLAKLAAAPDACPVLRWRLEGVRNQLRQMRREFQGKAP